jgi:hypothetical protein
MEELEGPSNAELEVAELSKQLDARILNAVATLMEFADSVQITCTKIMPVSGGTMTRSLGGGNFYARLASVNEWYQRNHS